MSAVPIQRTDAQEAEYRAAWLNQNKAPKNWVVLTIEEVAIIRSDLSRVTNDWHRLGKLLEEYEHAQVGLKRDLARVTAELDHAQGITEKLPNVSVPQPCQMRAELAEASLKVAREQISALRARVAELDRINEINAKEWESLHSDYDTLKQRNADLVPVLEKIAKSDPLANGRYAAHNAAQALARAESAMPAKLCKHCGGAGVIHDTDIDGNITGYCDFPKCSATPAKHPDTEILEWLDSAACYRWMIAVGGDREEELHKMRPWKIRDAVRYCIAACKQEASK